MGRSVCRNLVGLEKLVYVILQIPVCIMRNIGTKGDQGVAELEILAQREIKGLQN